MATTALPSPKHWTPVSTPPNRIPLTSATHLCPGPFPSARLNASHYRSTPATMYISPTTRCSLPWQVTLSPDIQPSSYYSLTLAPIHQSRIFTDGLLSNLELSQPVRTALGLLHATQRTAPRWRTIVRARRSQRRHNTYRGAIYYPSVHQNSPNGLCYSVHHHKGFPKPGRTLPSHPYSPFPRRGPFYPWHRRSWSGFATARSFRMKIWRCGWWVAVRVVWVSTNIILQFLLNISTHNQPTIMSGLKPRRFDSSWVSSDERLLAERY